MSIGVFDSGLGGLTVLKSLTAALPNQSFVYLGDHANAPYGTRSSDDVLRLTQAAVQTLWGRGCKLVILACNTASAIALRPIQTQGVAAGCNVLGVFVPMIEGLTGRPWGDLSAPVDCSKSLALFATPATVASRAFPRELAMRAMGVDVESQACDGLVEAIESGNTVRIDQCVKFHVQALQQRMPFPDHAVLACTHYPWVEEIFTHYLGPKVNIVNQASQVALSLVDYLGRHPQYGSSYRPTQLLTTGQPRAVSHQPHYYGVSHLCSSRFVYSPKD